MISGVQVEGLKDFRRDLKRIDEELTKQLRLDLLAIGKDIADDARGRVPQRSGAAARSVRAGVSGNTAYVAGGSATVPYYGWLDFGTRIPALGNPRTVGPWTKSGAGPSGGRFIYKSIQSNDSKIADQAKEAFDKAADAALKKSY